MRPQNTCSLYTRSHQPKRTRTPKCLSVPLWVSRVATPRLLPCPEPPPWKVGYKCNRNVFRGLASALENVPQHCRTFRGIRDDWHYTCFCLGMPLILHFANINSRLIRFTYISCTSYTLCTPSYSSAAYLKTQTGSMLPHTFLLQCRLVRAN